MVSGEGLSVVKTSLPLSIRNPLPPPALLLPSLTLVSQSHITVPKQTRGQAAVAPLFKEHFLSSISLKGII